MKSPLRGAGWTTLALVLLAAATACGGGSKESKGAAGSSANGGAGGSGGSASGGMGNVPPVELPVPPGQGDLSAPSGAEANLRVLPWAGFGSAVTYSIDDSQPSQIDHWSELSATGVRMTFYVNTSGSSYPGYDATFQAALAEGHEIGNHTVNHCHADLTGCNANLGSIEKEIDDCSSYIVSRIGQAGVWTLAYPFGDTGFEPATKSRFFMARGVGGGTVGPEDAIDPFNLPIFGAVGEETTEALNGHIDGVRTQGRWLVFLFHSILPTTQNWYAGVDIGSITGSIDYAKGLGDVWLDSVVNVGAYWLGARTLRAVVPATADDKTSWTWSLPAHFPPGHALRVVVDGGTLSQGGEPLVWNGHGYYEVALDAGTLTWSP